MNKTIGLVNILMICLAGCAAPVKQVPPTDIPTPSSEPVELPTASLTAIPLVMPSLVPSAIPDARLPPERWQEWPVVPIIRPEMKALFKSGLQAGNNPAAFIKIGDGEISTVWFLTQYDLGAAFQNLGPYSELEWIIKHFSGSYRRIGTAAGRGYNTDIILGPVPGGTVDCHPGESHLGCEVRITRPSFAILSLGTNQVWQPEVFEPGMRQIIEQLIKAKVVPILSTKGDNLEGDNQINLIIARLAYEYDLPLWNFWLALQPLPNHGMQSDREHLTLAPSKTAYSDFNDPTNFQYAWTWRNLTALQVLDAVYQAVSSQP
jgi:hypothetical protein